MKAVVAAFNQEKALVGAFSVITNLRMELFKALWCRGWSSRRLNLAEAVTESDNVVKIADNIKYGIKK